MKTRRASISDLKELTKLFEMYRTWYGKDENAEQASIFLRERMEKEESIVFVVENDEKELLGFTQLYPVFSSTRMKKLWLLNDLFVHENCRGKGLSKLLIKAAQDLCRHTGACAVTLETGKNNDIGNQLYPVTGFELNTDYNFYEWTCVD